MSITRNELWSNCYGSLVYKRLNKLKKKKNKQVKNIKC